MRMKSGEIETQGVATVGRYRIDGQVVGTQFRSIMGAHYGNSPTAPPVVVNKEAFGVGRVPLKHRALLPIPGEGGGKRFKPTITVQPDDAHGGAVFRRWRAVIEADLMGKEQASGRIPGTLIVITEKMMLRSERYRTHDFSYSSEVQDLVKRRRASRSIHRVSRSDTDQGMHFCSTTNEYNLPPNPMALVPSRPNSWSSRPAL